MNFEEKISKLQSICAKMEDENLGLDEGLKLYEEGANLAKDCYSDLNTIKGKVTVIKQDLDKYKEEFLD